MSDYRRSERYNGAGSPEEMEQDERVRAEFRKQFGVEWNWQPEAAAPAITDETKEKMRAMFRLELPSDEEDHIRGLILRFRSWSKCFRDITKEVVRSGEHRLFE